MSWRCSSGVLALMSVWQLAYTGRAAEPAPPPLLRSAEVAELQIVLGRLRARAPRRGKFVCQNVTRVTAGRRETLAVSQDHGQPTLRYQLTEDNERWTLVVLRGRDVTLERASLRNAAARHRVAYLQPADGDVRLQIETPQGDSELRAASLWHLLLQHADVCQRHLVPMLEQLWPQWSLPCQAAPLRVQLLRVAEAPGLPSRERLQTLVAQLGCSEYRSRQQADRRLREWGISIHRQLEQLDLQTLNSEQRLRVQRMRRDLEPQGADTHLRTAFWLAGDPGVWLAMLQSQDAQSREVAAGQLQRLCGRSIAFDPQAAEQQRQQQIERLRNQLAADR